MEKMDPPSTLEKPEASTSEKPESDKGREGVKKDKFHPQEGVRITEAQAEYAASALVMPSLTPAPQVEKEVKKPGPAAKVKPVLSPRFNANLLAARSIALGLRELTTQTTQRIEKANEKAKPKGGGERRKRRYDGDEPYPGAASRNPEPSQKE